MLRPPISTLKVKSKFSWEPIPKVLTALSTLVFLLCILGEECLPGPKRFCIIQKQQEFGSGEPLPSES